MRILSDQKQQVRLQQWLISAVVSITCMVILPAFFGQYYATIDDARLMYVYAGYASGTPTGTYLFSNVVFSAFLSKLYTWIPQINWYLTYHRLFIFGFLLLLGAVIQIKSDLGRFGSALLHAFMTVLCFGNAIILMHFEETACLTACAGLLLLFLSEDCQTDCRRRICCGLAPLCLVLCFMQEKNTFLVGACYFVLVLMYLSYRQFLTRRNQFWRWIRTGFLILASIGVLVAALSLVQKTVKSNEIWSAYAEYNPYRISFWDYDHPSFDEAPELYLNAGWSREFTELSEQMYFIDPRFSKEGLSQIVGKFNRTSSVSDQPFLTAAAEAFRNTFKKEPKSLAELIFAASLLAILLIWVLRKPRVQYRMPVFWTAVLGLFGMLALLFYLGWRGRLPLRAFDVVVLPYLVVLLSLLLPVVGERRAKQFAHTCRRGGSLRTKKLLTVGLCALLVLNAVFCIRAYRMDIKKIDYRLRASADVRSLESYVSRHPDDFYICDQYAAQNYAVDTHDPKLDLSNLLIWGSSYIYTAPYYQQIARYGFRSIGGQTYLEPNVYVVLSKSVAQYRSKFLAYLKKDHRYLGLQIVDQIGDAFYVCRVMDFSSDKPDGLIQHLGQTYHLKDGRLDYYGPDTYHAHDVYITEIEGNRYILDTFGTVPEGQTS